MYSLCDFYCIFKTLETESYGSILQGIDKRTKAKRAIKVFPKTKIRQKSRFAMEIEMLRNLVYSKFLHN